MGSLILQASPKVISATNTQDAVVAIAGMITMAAIVIACMYFMNK